MVCINGIFFFFLLKTNFVSLFYPFNRQKLRTHNWKSHTGEHKLLLFLIHTNSHEKKMVKFYFVKLYIPLENEKNKKVS